MHQERVLDAARKTVFCPSATGLGYFRAKLEFKGTPKVFTSPLLPPLQGLLRKNESKTQNSQGSWPCVKGTSPLQQDLCCRRKRLLLQLTASPRALAPCL